MSDAPSLIYASYAMPPETVYLEPFFWSARELVHPAMLATPHH